MLRFAYIGLAAAALALGPQIATALPSDDGRDRVVEIHNRGGESIFYLHASDTRLPDWGPDRLGTDGNTNVIIAGETARITIDDGDGTCAFDFKFRFRNGREVTQRDINVCAVSHIDVTEGGARITR